MATSREPLHVAGEQEYPVPPFTLDEGVGFFAARARAVKPDFEIDESVPKICRRLDSLPLALELAAARTKALDRADPLPARTRGLPLLTGGNRDAPERQHTLRRRSSGATTSCHPKSSTSLVVSPSSRAGARSTLPRWCVAPSSTPCSRWWRRTSSASRASATGCWRRSGVRAGSAR